MIPSIDALTTLKNIPNKTVVRRIRRAIIKLNLIFLVVPIAFIIIMKLHAHFTQNAEWYTYDRTLSVNILGDRFSRTSDPNHKYSGYLSDYGLNPADFTQGDELILYIDQTPTETKMVKITTPKEYEALKEKKLFIQIYLPATIFLLTAVIFVIIFRFWARDYELYLKWLESKSNDLDDLYKMFEK